MGVGNSSKNLASRWKSVASKAAMLPVELEAGALHALGVACRDDHLGSLFVCPPGGLEADAGAAADHEERLPGELLVALDHAAARPDRRGVDGERLEPHVELGRCRHLTSVLSVWDTRSSCAPRCGVAPGGIPGRRRPACSNGDTL